MSDNLSREEFTESFVAEIRAVYESGSTVGHIAHDYELEPELVRNILGDTKPPKTHISRGELEAHVLERMKEAMRVPDPTYLSSEVLQKLAKVAVDTIDDLGCAPPRK